MPDCKVLPNGGNNELLNLKSKRISVISYSSVLLTEELPACYVVFVLVQHLNFPSGDQ